MLIVRPLPVAVIIVVAGWSGPPAGPATLADAAAFGADSCIIKCLGQSFDAWPCQ